MKRDRAGSHEADLRLFGWHEIIEHWTSTALDNLGILGIEYRRKSVVSDALFSSEWAKYPSLYLFICVYIVPIFINACHKWPIVQKGGHNGYPISFF